MAEQTDIFGLGLSFRVTRISQKNFAKTTRGIRDAIGRAFVAGTIERYLVRRHKFRFAPAGSKPGAQTSPDGVPWEDLSWPRIHSKDLGRKKNLDFTQKLVETGQLRDSIAIVSSTFNRILSTGTAKAELGVVGPAAAYAELHQFGGINSQGFYVPARPFMGTTDFDAWNIERFLKRSVDRALEGKPVNTRLR